MASANIFQQYLRQPRSIIDNMTDLDQRDLARARLEGARNQNALTALTMEQTRGTMADAAAKRNAIQQIYAQLGPTATPQARAAALQANPLTAGEGIAAEKGLLENDRLRSENASKQADANAKQAELNYAAVDRYARNLAFVQKPEDVVKYVDTGISLKILPPELRDEMVANAGNVEAWKQAASGIAVSLVDKFKEEASMARSRLQSDTQLATNAATNARMAAEGAANRGVQMRGQNLTDARSRESNEIQRIRDAAKTGPSKPMPGTAVKLQNEELQALGIFSGLDADLGALEKQLSEGTLKFGPVRNLANQARNATGFSNEESRNLATFKAKIEGLRNAVLLLNKGVQTEGDAQRAMAEVIANINDPEVVAQRLSELRVLNRRAADLHKNNVDLLRSNYDQEPMDFSKFEAQPATVNLGAAVKPNTVKPSGKASGTIVDAPKPGTVQDGYRFKGGNPADPKSWEKVA